MNLKCKLPNFFDGQRIRQKGFRALAILTAFSLLTVGVVFLQTPVQAQEELKVFPITDGGSYNLDTLLKNAVDGGFNAISLKSNCRSLGPNAKIGKEIKELTSEKNQISNSYYYMGGSANEKLIISTGANLTVKNVTFKKKNTSDNVGCTVEIEKGAQVTFENCNFDLPPVNHGQVIFKGCDFPKGIKDYASDTTKYLSSDGQPVQGPTNLVPTLTLTKPEDADENIAAAIAGQFGKSNSNRGLALTVPYQLGGTATNAQITATVGKKESPSTPVKGLTARVIKGNPTVEISNIKYPASGSGEPTVTEIPAGVYTIRITATATGASPETATIEYEFTIPPKDGSQPQPPVPGPNPDPHQPQPPENNLEFKPDHKDFENTIGVTKDFEVKLAWEDKTTHQPKIPTKVAVKVSHNNEIISQNRDVTYVTAKYDATAKVLKIHQDAQAPAGTYLIQLTATFDNNQTSKNTIQLIVKNKPSGGNDNNNPGSSSPGSKGSSYFDLRAIPFACETCPKAKTSAKKDDVPDTAAAARLFCSLN